MISRDTIDKVREADIVPVIQNFVDLKRQGATYTACCPFHDEKTPSFVVSPSKQIYKCFGCGKSGDALRFVMEYEKKEFIDAVKLIAELQNIIVEYEFDSSDTDRKNALSDQEKLFKINEAAMRRYRKELWENAPEYVSNDLLGSRQIRLDTIQYWELGYAPNNFQFITDEVIEHGIHGAAKKIGLTKTKDGRNYDFFVDRLMFPIRNHKGRLAGFSGRTYNDDYAKYLNSAESDIFEKHKLLFGLYQNARAIRKKGYALVVEGQFDVVSLWQRDHDTAVASSGTAFTDNHATILRRYTDQAYLWFDTDKAGRKATIQTLKLLTKHDFHTFIVISPDGEDPDSVSRKFDVDQLINDAVDAIEHCCMQYFEAADTVMERDKALDQVAEIMSCISKQFKIDQYVKMFVRSLKRNYGLKAADLKERIHKIQQKLLKKGVKNLDKDEKSGPITQNQRRDRSNYGFYAGEKLGESYGYYFPDQSGHDIQRSNFTLNPIGLIESFDNPRRIFEIRNENNVKKILEIGIDDFISLQRFKSRVEAKGKFLFDGTASHMNRLKHKLFAEERVFEEIDILGYHPDGFYSFSNGIYNSTWREIDEYGIAEHNGKHYFIPALSAIYKRAAGAFVHMKPFIYKPQPIGFERWSKLFYDVYDQKNGLLGILFFVASVHRDIYFDRLSFFPLAFFFGMPGTGKTTAAESLTSMYGDRLDMTNLTSTTKSGFFRKLNQYRNAIICFDEYKNELDKDVIESLKSAWNGQSYNKGMKNQGNTTAKLDVESAVLVSGQHLPTADPALFERCILSIFNERKFNREAFNELKELELSGLTSVLVQVFKYREQVEAEFYDTYNALVSQMSIDLVEKYHVVKFKDRFVKNYAILLSVCKILHEMLIFPFTYEEAYDTIMAMLSSQVKMMGGSNDLAQWWDIVENLSSIGVIRHGKQYKIEHSTDEGCDVLYIRFGLVHAQYMKDYRQQRSKTGLEKSSLSSYLKNAPEWLRALKNTRFDGNSGSSAYAFNYDIIQETYDITMRLSHDQVEPEVQEVSNLFPGKDDNDDLPF